jgi:RNA polymerase sigma-70 factor (ECF subfamily)
LNETDRQIEEHIPRLRRYARSLVWERGRADDLVQDTLERAWGQFHLWRRGSDLRAWLFSIMHNIHANNVRADCAIPAQQSLDEDELNIPVRATQEDGLQVRDIQAALDCLPVEQREVLLLVGLEEMHYEEVAKVLSVPVGTVMSRLSRGREHLRQIMAGKATTELRVVK